jgi:uncharacterized protein (TIGR02266 family)
MTDERRSQKRVPFYVEVQWEGATGKHQARTSDISMGGCFIDTVGQANVGEVLLFKMRLPSGEPIELEGEVTYVAESIGFGVRFRSITEDEEQKIEWLVKAEEQRLKS